jgi:hypothetical protein
VNPYWDIAKGIAGTAWDVLKSIPWQAWAFAIGVCLCMWYGENRADAREELVREEYNIRDAAAADELAKANAANRAAEIRQAEEIASIAAQFDEEKNRAIQETRDTVLADLRSGKLRLRIPSGGCPARSGQATAPAGIGDDAAEVWGEDSLHLAVADSIAIADEADAHVKACQRVIQTYRGPQ